MVIGVFCFRNDLRLHDNQALQNALNQCDKLYLIYSFEDRVWKSENPRRISIHRAQFILESVLCLSHSISKAGGFLHITQGNIEDAIPIFMEEVGADICFLSEENAWEEKGVENSLSKIVHLRTDYNKTLIHLKDLPFEFKNLPETFSKFRKLVEGNWQVDTCVGSVNVIHSSCHKISTLPPLKDFGLYPSNPSRHSCFKFKGGTLSGQERLKDWIWRKGCISKYKETRNQLSGPDFSSRFSPWISIGCLSPREIYWEIKKYESKHGSNESTYWLIFELLWRDFFQFSARFHGAKIFHSRGIHPERPSIHEPENAESLFVAWKNGRTSNSFINANMNELRETGWMSNRGRQNVASYLVNDLGLEWRRGAEWFEEQLIDYDPCSNYGNWLYLSGFGNDPRTTRYFNTSKQSATYDPDGNYTRAWA